MQIRINKAKAVQMSDRRCFNCQLSGDRKVAINEAQISAGLGRGGG